MVAELTLAALVAEAMIGYPAVLHRFAPHPVTWVGAAISRLEKTFNAPELPQAQRRWLGLAVLGLIAVVAGALGYILQITLAASTVGGAILVLVATLGLAQRSLFQHVRAVLKPLAAGDLPAARAAVGRIVGRDVEALDAAGVAGAALESLGESFNDGVVAPAFWLLVGGLPGLFVYKVVNTADSLIGHREARWRAFGWASARADDLMNLIPARIAGLLIALAGRRGFSVMLRDAPRHASPNAGWPEAAMAGALGVTLGGPAAYDGAAVEQPRFGDGPAPGAPDLKRGLRLYLIACGLLWLLTGAVAWLL